MDNGNDLFSQNTPMNFWRCENEVSDQHWEEAIAKAIPMLKIDQPALNSNNVLHAVLGEGQFGPDHWNLGLVKRLYYSVKPLLPRPLTRLMRQVYSSDPQQTSPLGWPVEDRFAAFQWEIMRNLLDSTDHNEITFLHFWPKGYRLPLILTHDIETADGQEQVRLVADLEERYGLRSSFNFVPERYPLDQKLIAELRERGFEVGIHGLKHDGKLFNSKAQFMRRAERINNYLKNFDAVGFRAPLTHRHPEWMQALEIEYDSSFFDTDPFEPIPGGTMSIWPFQLGHFIELPYTLVQDYTLTAVLGETTPEIWLNKLEFLEKHFGMALLNTHPDYLKVPSNLKVYSDFLESVHARETYWHALPREIAAWWRARLEPGSAETLDDAIMARVKLVDNELIFQVN